MHISDITPQHITEQNNSVTITFSTNVSATVSVDILDSNGVNWLELSLENSQNNQYQLTLVNTKEIAAAAMLIIKAGDTQEYLPVQFSGYTNQAPEIDIVDSIEILQGSSVSIPLSLSDDVNSETMTWGYYSENSEFINNDDISYQDGLLTINLNHELTGTGNIIVTAFDGELQSRKTVAVTVKRTIYRAPTIPEEVTLYVNAGETLTRLLPGYSIDNDEIAQQLSQSPQQGTLSIAGDSFTYNANADFKEDSFILQSQLVANGDENISDETHTTLVSLKPRPVLQLPYQQQMLSSSRLTVLLTHRGDLWYWGTKVDLVDGGNAFVEIPVPTLLNSGDWVDVVYHSGLRVLLALNADGSLWSMGYSDIFQEGAGTSWQPLRVGTDSDWIAINGSNTSAASRFFLTKRDGSLWAMVFEFNNYEMNRQPKQVNGLYHWVDSTDMKEDYILLDNQGIAWTGGNDYAKTLGRKKTMGLIAPIEIPEPVLKVTGGFYRDYAYTDSGIYAWGSAVFLSDKDDKNFLLPELVNEMSWQESSISGGSFSGITPTGELYTASPLYSVSQLGRGEYADTALAQVGTHSNWRASYSIYESTYALQADGSFWVTGTSYSGLILGLGEASGSTVYQFTQLTELPLDILGTEDSDADGILNFRDDDDDNDCIIDSLDIAPDVYDPQGCVDTDNDGLIDVVDLDDDNDGVLDSDDAFPLDATESVDTDGDGIGNNADTDDDNDGVLDSEDAFPLDATESVDTDGDGIGNNADTDDDNDGVLDSDDAFPLDATESVDTDGDGIGNNVDTDDDNDGVLDSDDAFPLDATESVDTDGDGIGNNADTDDDNDGVEDSKDAYPLDATRSAVETPQTQTKKSSGGGSVFYLLWILTSLSLYRKCKYC